MAKIKKSQLEIRKRRIFSEEFKRQKVQQIVEKKLSIAEVSELYGVARMTVYRWLYKFSPHHKKGTTQVIQMESEEHKTKQLLKKVAELEQAIGRKQLHIDYLEKLIAICSDELKIDLKKNFGQSHSNGSDSIKTKHPGQ
ncbi:MAG: transposase [Saprospirales bacterium]|nr:transposase [Saprospirales bacterium]